MAPSPSHIHTIVRRRLVVLSDGVENFALKAVTKAAYVALQSEQQHLKNNIFFVSLVHLSKRQFVPV